MEQKRLFGLADGNPGRCFLGQLADDAKHVLLEDEADGHGGGIVIVPDVAEGRKVAVFHHPEGGEDHGDTEGAYRQATDGGDGIVPKDGVVFSLDLVEVFVEVLALLCRETNLNASVLLQAVVEGEELATEDFEMVVQGFSISFVQDIEPDEEFVQAVEEEAGEEAVFYAGHQVGDLLRRAGEDGGNAGLLDADVFPFRATEVGDGLVLEALTEALGEVAEVLAETGGEDIAFGLEEEALAVVLIEGLVDGGGAAIGRDKEEADGRRRGLRDTFAFLLALVSLLFFSVIHLQFVAFGPQFFVNRVNYGPAEGEPAFAATGTGGDKEVKVSEEFPAGVDGIDVRQAGRYGGEGAQDEHVGIGLRVTDGRHFLQEGRELVLDTAVEGGHEELSIVTISSIISITGVFLILIPGGSR